MNQCESTASERAIPHALPFNFRNTRNTGRAMMTLPEREWEKGTYSMNVLKKGLSTGLYLIRSTPSRTRMNARISTNWTATNNNHRGISLTFRFRKKPTA
jgi:hypothetical protein